MPVKKIIKSYREQQKMSLREFSSALVENTGLSLSHQAVKLWEDGEHEPAMDFLMTLALKCRDWRGDFAFDCLAALRPDLYQPATSIRQEKIEVVTVYQNGEK